VGTNRQQDFPSGVCRVLPRRFPGVGKARWHARIGEARGQDQRPEVADVIEVAHHEVVGNPEEGRLRELIPASPGALLRCFRDVALNRSIPVDGGWPDLQDPSGTVVPETLWLSARVSTDSHGRY